MVTGLSSYSQYRRRGFPGRSGAAHRDLIGPARTESPSLRLVCCVLVLSVAIVWSPPPLSAQETKPAKDGQRYAKTPDTLIPYREFREPYARFFQTIAEFLGSGRDKTSAQTPRTVRIGLFAPTGSAPDADLGREMIEGVQLAIEQANTAGGYKGIPFEIVQRADTGLWGASSNEMVAFSYQDDVLAVIGSVDGANTHIALRVALKTKMPMVNTATTDPTLTETAIPWMLRCMADDRQQGYALAHHIIEECGIGNIVALRVNDRYGRMGIQEFRDAARRLKKPLRAELRFERGDRDFAVQLDRIDRLNGEAVVVWANASDAGAIVQAIRARHRTGDKPPLRIFGCDRLVSAAFLRAAGESAEGVVAVATYDPTQNRDRYMDFSVAFGARFGHKPGTFAAHAYDGASILIEAVRDAGLNRVRIRDALAGRRRFEGVTGPIEFDTTQNDVGPVYIATVQDNRFVYRKARFTDSAGRADCGRAPYRAVSESPPVARPPSHPANVKATLRVGCFLPLDDAGRAVVRGVQMALAKDAARHPDRTAIELLVRDARGPWGDSAASLVNLVFKEEVLAVMASTERRGTHLAQMLAAKMHFPVIAFCEDDPTITQIPMPWVFSMPGPPQPIDPGFSGQYSERFGMRADQYAAWGFDAGTMIAEQIRAGAHDRLALRNGIAGRGWIPGVSGTFRFDALGNRQEVRFTVSNDTRVPVPLRVPEAVSKTVMDGRGM